MNKRNPSVYRMLKRAAADNMFLRVTLPDGTIVETLTGAADLSPHAAVRSKVDSAIDEISRREIRPRSHR